MEKIMIIEDDASLREELSTLLRKNGYLPIEVQDFGHELELLEETQPDLVLLDILLPNQDGDVLLQKIRKTSNIPIIMVTSKNTELDEAFAISYGADDYITKPYHPQILLLRIKAILKRMNHSHSEMQYKDVKIFLGRGLLKKKDQEVLLTKNEMLIFSCLLSHLGELVTRDELMMNLWNNDEYINENALTVNMSRLRTKLKDIGYPDVILTRKGEGYILL